MLSLIAVPPVISTFVLSLQRLQNTIEGLPLKPSLIVLDTFARTFVGADENAAKDVGEWNSRCAETPAGDEGRGVCGFRKF
jgi:hypothetical protein